MALKKEKSDDTKKKPHFVWHHHHHHRRRRRRRLSASPEKKKKKKKKKKKNCVVTRTKADAHNMSAGVGEDKKTASSSKKDDDDDDDSEKKQRAAVEAVSRIEKLIECIQSGTVEDVEKACASFRDQSECRTARDVKGRGCMHLVAQRKDAAAVDICKHLVEKVKCDVEMKDEDGATAVLIAASRANYLVLEYLLVRANADALVTSKYEMNAWHYLATWDGGKEHAHKTKDVLMSKSGRKEQEVRKLLETKANDKNTGSPFLFAVRCGSHEVAKLLSNELNEEKKGAHHKETLASGVGAAVLATASGCMETLRFVLEECKVDANQRAEGGMSALHVLASHPKWAGMDKEDSKMREKAIDILIKNGADANAQDKDGMKAIHTAAACKREDMVEHLLSHTEKDAGLKEGDEWNAQAVMRRVEELIMKIRREHSGQAECNSEQESPHISIEGHTISPKKKLSEKEMKEAGQYKRLGDEAFVAGKYQDALDAYTKSLKTDEWNAKVWANMSACNAKLKDYLKARKDAVTARSLDPTYLKAWYREGKAAREMNDFEGAAVAFFEGLRLDESNADLKNAFEEAVSEGRRVFMQQEKSTNKK